MYSTCSSSFKLAQKIAAEQRQRELKLERKYRKPIKEIRHDAKIQRKQSRRQQQQQQKAAGKPALKQSERAKHHSYVSTLLKEDDADLLEQHRHVATPQHQHKSTIRPSASSNNLKEEEITSTSPKSEGGGRSLPLLDLFQVPTPTTTTADSVCSAASTNYTDENEAISHASSTPARRPRSASIPDEVSATKIKPVATLTGKKRNSNHRSKGVGGGSASFRFGKSIFGRLLSGEITTSSPIQSSAAPIDEDSKGEAQLESSSSATATTRTIAKSNSDGTSSGCVSGNRAPSSSSSSSIIEQKRKLIETVQFAEAVGEIPIQINQGGLQIIEDDEIDIDYSDDDYDDNAIISVVSESEASIITRKVQIPVTTLPATEGIHNHESTPLPPSTSSKKSSKDDNLPDRVNFVVTVDHRLHPYRKRKTRPQWPFGQLDGIDDDIDDHESSLLLDKLSDEVPGESEPADLKGINQNSLTITKRGISRGNYAQLHRKAWLEVSDYHHRYGKNLRLYYRHWETLNCPTNKFFDWLDSKGEAAGQPLPNLDDCPRSVLDCDTVLYITNPKITEGYALDIIPSSDEGVGRIVDVDGDPVDTGPDGWIFVIRDHVMYGAPKITSVNGPIKQRFHHSSFFGGKAVAAAGIIITNKDGDLTLLYPHSGHYRPGEADMQRCLFFLHRKGVDLRTFDIDIQQISHVSRAATGGGGGSGSGSGSNINVTANVATTAPAAGENNKTAAESSNTNSTNFYEKTNNKKKKKVDTLQLENAVIVACFLAHKARFIGCGIFSRIQQIAVSDATTVTEALLAVDYGGYWRQFREVGF